MISIINWVRACFDFSLLCYLSCFLILSAKQLHKLQKDYASYRPLYFLQDFLVYSHAVSEFCF